jgi:hypothetical protein
MNIWKIARNELFYENYLKFISVILRAAKRDLSKKKAIKVMEEDWDFLIVLDACRYDLFKKVVDKDAGYVISGGSNTREWLEWNFDGEFKDCIYIAGNPYLAEVYLEKIFGFNPFYKIINVWDFGWDKYLKTVPPHEVTLAAIEIFKRFPDKRQIIHYNQPHHPFLKNLDLLMLDDGVGGVPTKKGGKSYVGAKRKHIWDYARLGQVPIQAIWKGYEENLRLVAGELEKIVDTFPGKIVVTSDHGNNMGEYWIYGHEKNLRTEGLVKVPWFVMKNDKNRIKPLAGDGGDGDPVELETTVVKEKIRELKRAGKI